MYSTKRHLLSVRMCLLVLTVLLSTAVAHAHDIVVCKTSDASSPVTAGTSFNFTLDGTTNFTLTVGGPCTTFANVGAGQHTITETGQAGVVVSQITVDPSADLVSLNLSARSVTVNVPAEGVTVTVTFVNKKQAATQGCTPGFWKQEFHFVFWVGFSPFQTVGSVFTGVLPELASENLLTALQGGGGPGLLGAEQILLRAAVAALLNSANGSISFPLTTSAIISAVNSAIATGNRDTILNLATLLDTANNGVGGCPLS